MVNTSPQHHAWIERARAVRLELELDRHGIKNLRRHGRELVGPCPQCGGDDRFAVNIEKQIFNCRRCGAKGDVIALVQFLDGCDFLPAVEKLAGEPPKPNGKDPAAEAKKTVAARFDYTDEAGNLLFQVERIEFQNADGSFVVKDGKRKKTFRQRRPDPESLLCWIWNIDGIAAVPYHLPELLEAIDNGNFVVIVEGEAKVDLLRSWNVPATCCAGGANKWRAEHSEFFGRADVVIVPDNDAPGREHADIVAQSLKGIAKRVRVLELPGLPPKGDVIDWSRVEGNTVEALHYFIEWQATEWTAPIAGTGTKQTDDSAPPANGPEDYGTTDAMPGNGGARRLILSSREFVAGFLTLCYLVDGLLQQSFLYALTGATGAGKTAITLRLAACVALGIPFAGCETKKGRVLYLAAENPVDIRMRWIALAQQMDFDADTIEVYFIEGVFKISQLAERLKAEAIELGGEFGLVIVDTGPAFYEGDDENNRVQQGKHAEMLRGLIDIIPGKPAVIVNVHPVKHATAENLLPAGGGNFLNAVDGNFTAARTDNTTVLHWQGKFRGPDFAPMHFMLRTVTHERLVTSTGRLVPTVVCDWISDEAKDQIDAAKVKDEDSILAAIEADPKASRTSLAIKMNWKLRNGDPHKTKVGRKIEDLKKQKLVTITRAGNYRLTDHGKEALNGSQTGGNSDE
jgi:AAA domain/CHC2 zinc finger